MIVYKCTCLLDNRVYIGITTKPLNTRKSHHLSKARRGSHLYFHKELMRVGFDNFKWEIINECNTQEELFNLEIKYISELKSNNKEFGFNMTKGGEFPDPAFGEANGMYGKTHTDEVKKILSDNVKGKTWEDRFGEEEAQIIKEKLINSHTGRKNSEKTLAKMRESSYWKKNGHLIKGDKNPNFGKHWDETKKNKVRGSNNGMYQKGYLLAGENNGMFGKHHTEEASRRMSEKRKGRGNSRYRPIDNIEEIIKLFKEYKSIGKVAKMVGERYNKIKRELMFEGVIDKNFRQGDDVF